MSNRIYDAGVCHCAAITADKQYCPLKDCHRFWLHSELCRRRNNGQADSKPVPYVEMAYSLGHCPHYVSIN